MNYYRVSIVKVGNMNRSKSFENWDDALAYIETAFNRDSSLVVLVRPDDTVTLYMDSSMQIANGNRVGPYEVYDLRPEASKAYIELVESKLEDEPDAQMKLYA